MSIQLHLGDCGGVLPTLAGDSVDAVVTDPPAGIAFMSKSFDTFKGRSHFVEFLTGVLAECLRVARPGSVLLCWALPRTSHWTGTAIEDAGWIIEERIAHVFGSGFPKHRSKLKPAVEDWWVARKPGPKWLGVDACRVGTDDRLSDGSRIPGRNFSDDAYEWTGKSNGQHPSGRWPANLCLTHHEMCNGECVEGCPIRLIGEQGGERTSGGKAGGQSYVHHKGTWSGDMGTAAHFCRGDSGSAARYFANFDAEPYDPLFYCPKASREDRNEGCEGMPKVVRPITNGHGLGPINTGKGGDGIRVNHPTANHHPTVKPTTLMRWLCRLACPEGGTILDPFMGSGSTGVAAVDERFGFVGIERDPDYFAIASARIEAERDRYPLFTRPADPAPTAAARIEAERDRYPLFA